MKLTAALALGALLSLGSHVATATRTVQELNKLRQETIQKYGGKVAAAARAADDTGAEPSFSKSKSTITFSNPKAKGSLYPQLKARSRPTEMFLFY